MRLRNMPRFTRKPLTVALASRVEGTAHVGSVVALGGQWIANGWNSEDDSCHCNKASSCGLIEQVRLLHRFLFAIEKGIYPQILTVVTASPSAESLIQGWRNGVVYDFDWCQGDMQNARRRIQNYPGYFMVRAPQSDEQPLVALASGLSELVFEGLSGVRDRTATANQARRLVAQLPDSQ